MRGRVEPDDAVVVFEREQEACRRLGRGTVDLTGARPPALVTRSASPTIRSGPTAPPAHGDSKVDSPEKFNPSEPRGFVSDDVPQQDMITPECALPSPAHQDNELSRNETKPPIC